MNVYSPIISRAEGHAAMSCTFDFLERCPELSAMMQGMPSREQIAQQCDSAQQMGNYHL